MIDKKMSESNNLPTEKQRTEVSPEVVVIAQELKITQSLACNDATKRNRQIRKLRKWLEIRSRSSFPFTEEDFMRIWKGLYYCMWMSDKPLVQEELSEQLGQLMQSFHGKLEFSIGFFNAFTKTMCREWFGIDQWRMDKFMMLVRRMLRYLLKEFKNQNWPKESIQTFNQYMTATYLADKSPAVSLTMHYMDIFLEELAKVADGNISAEQTNHFIEPFVAFMASNENPILVTHCRSRIFYHLLYQSELGRDYIDRYNAWKEMGFPTGSIKNVEKVDSVNEEDDEPEEPKQQTKQNHLDPRAGNVDVFIPELSFDANNIIENLNKAIMGTEMKANRRKSLRILQNILKTYSGGDFPLGIKTMPVIKPEPKEPLFEEKIESLDNLENEMYGTSRLLKKLNKRKRRKLLKSLNFEEADEDNLDKIIESAIPEEKIKMFKNARSSFLNGWIEEEIENLGPVKPKKKKKTVKKVLGPKTISNGEEAKQTKANQKKKPFQKEDAAKKVKRKNDDTKSEDSPKKQKMNGIDTVESTADNSIDASTPTTELKSPSKSKITNEWNEPLKDGEVEYFLPSRKKAVEEANKDYVVNPLFRKKNPETPILKGKNTKVNKLSTPTPVKRVKIMLKHNKIQKPSEYIRQIKSSPNIPYDASKQPGKGLLKPNSTPSPINPFYKHKIGMKLLNNSF